MFTPEDVQARLRTRPFVPAQFVLSTGEAYDVYHPDLVWVGRRFLTIGLPEADAPTFVDRSTRVALLHVAEIRDLPIPAAPVTNGPAA